MAKRRAASKTSRKAKSKTVLPRPTKAKSKRSGARLREAIRQLKRRECEETKAGPFLAPTYLYSYEVAPTWIDKLKYRKTLRYRCDRLAGLTNLYFWSLTWAVHHAYGWKLGARRTEYRLCDRLLWLLQIETIADIVAAGWVAPGITAHVQRLKESITGWFATENIESTPDRKLSVESQGISREVAKGGKAKPIVFTGDDQLSSVSFPNNEDPIPWHTIVATLRQAYVNAEKHLKAEGVHWKGPPLFNDFHFGQELIEDAKARRRNPKLLLRDLEAERRKRVREIETVIRGDVQREPDPQTRTLKPLVELRGQGQQPIVCGKAVGALPRVYYRVVECLCKAGIDGCSFSVLSAANGDAVKYLRNLVGLGSRPPRFLTDADSRLWKKAIHFAGTSRKGYSIVHRMLP